MWEEGSSSDACVHVTDVSWALTVHQAKGAVFSMTKFLPYKRTHLMRPQFGNFTHLAGKVNKKLCYTHSKAL